MRAKDLRVGDIIWIDNYQATILSMMKNSGGYDFILEIPQVRPLVDFHIYRWINRTNEIGFISRPSS